MDLKNINKIMSSNLWKKIKRNKNFLDFKIVDTSKKGYFNMLIVFFDMDCNENKMLEYLKKGRLMISTELLDRNPILRTYGRVRMIVYS